MGVCPVCNSMNLVSKKCSSCHEKMMDKGRFMDYFDDYSAYMPIELMKEIDGIKNDKQDEICPHVFVCKNCQIDAIVLIEEMK